MTPDACACGHPSRPCGTCGDNRCDRCDTPAPGVRMSNCVNGCQSRRTLDDGTTAQAPRLAEVGHLCEQCRNRLAGWLAASGIPEDYARLDDVALPGSVQAAPGSKRSKRTTAPVPLRLEVLDLVDGRNGHRSDGTTDRRGVVGLLESWGRLVREERNMAQPTSPATVVGECSFLHLQVDWLAGRAWIDEFYREIRSLARDLSTAIGYPWPQPIGSCPVDGCGEPLWMPPEGATVLRCAACGAQWAKDRWLMLAGIIESEAS